MDEVLIKKKGPVINRAFLLTNSWPLARTFDSLVHASQASPQQTALETVSLDGLVPKDHLLREIDAVIDFSFFMIGLPDFIARTTGDRRSIRR